MGMRNSKPEATIEELLLDPMMALVFRPGCHRTRDQVRALMREVSAHRAHGAKLRTQEDGEQV